MIPSPQPPAAKKIPHPRQIHGVGWEDPYFWLRDRSNPEVPAYLKEENAYTDAVMKPTEPLQEKLYQEILGRIKETDLSVPVRIDSYYYYSRTEKGKQYGISCRKRGSLEAPEEIILDLNELAKGHEYFGLGPFSVSPNHEWLAYGTDTQGSETYTVYIKNLRTRLVLSDVIPNCATSLEWAQDNKTFFYTLLNEAKRPFKLMRHTLSANPAHDACVFHEKDEGFVVTLHKSKSRKFFFLHSDSSTSSEVHLLKTGRPEDAFQIVHPREPKLEYELEHHQDRFFILTNENAVNFKLMEAPLGRPSKDHWKEVVPHRAQVRLEDIDVFENHLVLFEREEGLTKIQVTDLSSQETHYLDFLEPVYTAWGGNNPEFKTQTLRFGYTSLVTPTSIFDYDMKSRRRELKKQTEVLGGYDPGRYQTERIFAESYDGVRVPISLVYRKGAVKDGSLPLFLYGYGSYGLTSDPEFSSIRLSLLDRGFVYAIAHVRGGGDLGRPWYEDGKLLKKKNTFKDFIACAEHLIREKWTNPKKLVIYGGSAGGMLMGAAANERPELFHAVIAKVPFLDVLNTMLDKSLPLTVQEFEEWGNPEDKVYFDYIRSYSPYDNIREQAYPHMLVSGGLNDPRVQFWEPAKWTAKLRAHKKDSNLLLLKTEMGAGHGGPSGRYDALREIAFDYAFLLSLPGKGIDPANA